MINFSEDISYDKEFLNKLLTVQRFCLRVCLQAGKANVQRARRIKLLLPLAYGFRRTAAPFYLKVKLTFFV
jgi:hypothetical protein